MVRVKHEPHYKGSNPKLERINTILKFSKELEKLIMIYQTEELLNNSNSPIINQTPPSPNSKRRGRPKKNKETINNKDTPIKEEIKEENKEIDTIINNFDDTVNIDYTGVSTLMNNDIELK